MTEDYPRGAYILLLVGGILEILGGITLMLAGSLYVMVSGTGAPAGTSSGVVSAPLIGGFGEFMGFICIIAMVVWNIAWGVFMILAAKNVKTGNPDLVHKGAVLGLIASILGMNIISLIGAILAFMWKPAPQANLPPPPPM